MADLLATVFTTYCPEIQEAEIEKLYDDNKEAIEKNKEFKRAVELLAKNNTGKKFSRTDSKLATRVSILLNNANEDLFESKLIGYIALSIAALLAVKSKDVKFFVNLYTPPDTEEEKVKPKEETVKPDANDVLEKIKKLLA